MKTSNPTYFVMIFKRSVSVVPNELAGCEIYRLHGYGIEKYYLLGCDSVQCGDTGICEKFAAAIFRVEEWRFLYFFPEY
jgi:hypothetical protein